MSSCVVLLIALLIQSIFCGEFDPTTHRAWHLFNDKACGIRTQQRVVGGKDAAIGEFPWVVPIFVSLEKEGENGTEITQTSCGAAIISEQFVLTAAHCNPHHPNGTIDAMVMAGELDMDRDPDCDKDNFCPPSAKEFKVEKFISHPGYSFLVGDDIAVVKIEGKFQFDGYVTPVCLEYGPLLSEDYAGTISEFAGWGVYKIDPVTFETSGPSVLQKITLPIQDEKTCSQTLQQITNEYFHDKIKFDSFICAGGESAGQHIYYGDSGGILVVPKSVGEDIPRFYGVGVTALTYEKLPRISVADGYSRVSYYMEWILDTIADELGI